MGKFTCTGYGFAKKGTKILRHYGTKKIRHCEERSDEAISLKLQASVQRNVAIASNRDLRKQNTECAVRRCNDAVGAVPIHSNVRFSSCSFAINGSARKKLTVFPFRPQLTHAFFGSFSFFLHHNKKKEMNKKRDCFAALAMTVPKALDMLPTFKPLEKSLWGIRKKCAFTLSEVLIVLAVLGVIAAITIPDLIQDYREKALITALKKNYAVFSQAVDMAIAENGIPTTWDIGTSWGSDAGASKLYDILKPYLRVEKECGIQKGCLAEHYKALFGGSFYSSPATDAGHARGVLSSGVPFSVWSYGSGCSAGNCARIIVDVNGQAGPNKVGVDLFYFIITEDGLIPAGHDGNWTCKYNAVYVDNGSGCAYWAIKHENMDYLRKAGTYTNY